MLRDRTRLTSPATALSAVAFAVALAACGGASLPSDAPEVARLAHDACSGQSGPAKQDCYEGYLLEQLEAEGVAPALQALEAIAVADRDVERDGHVYTHAIGINAYDPDEPVADVFVECTTLFQSGCYHGVIQAHFMAAEQIGPETVEGLCAPYQDGDRWILFQCLHGLGHGLTMVYNHHLPRALAGCDLLERAWDRESCYGGAFMENVLAATHPHHPASELASASGGGDHAEHVDAAHEHSDGMAMSSDGTHAADEPEWGEWVPLKAEDPHYPCSALDSRYGQSCYMMQTSVMLWHNDGDIGQAAEQCLDAPTNRRRTCFQSLGRDVSSYTLQEPGPSLRECQKVVDDFRGWCYVGLVKNFIDLTARTESAFDFCRRVEPGHKSRCYEAIGEEVHVLRGSEEQRREECSQAESMEFVRSCLRGARVAS